MTESEVTPAESPALNISIDRSKITLGDMRFMIKTRSQKEKTSVEDVERIFDFLERVVVGGIEDIPFDAMQQVMEAVFSQMNPESEIKN